MIDEIERLWKLVEECRMWSRCITETSDNALEQEFIRLAAQLDEIAYRLAARLPT